MTNDELKRLDRLINHLSHSMRLDLPDALFLRNAYPALRAELDRLRDTVFVLEKDRTVQAERIVLMELDIASLRKVEAAAIPARALLAKFKRWNDCDDERVSHETEAEVLNEVSMEVDDVLNDLSAALASKPEVTPPASAVCEMCGKSFAEHQRLSMRHPFRPAKETP